MILRVARSSSIRDPPDLYGFERDGSEWRLQVDHYATFIHDTTGVPLEGELSLQQIKTIQARLEGCIESYERDGQCVCDDFEKYEHVDSIRSAHELSRFFRELLRDRMEEQEAPQ